MNNGMSPGVWRAVWPGLLMISAAAGFPMSAQTDPGIHLREVAAEWGLDYRHRHGGAGQRLIIETMGCGLVIFDFDEDGDPDVFFIGGAPSPGYGGELPESRLYRNDGDGRFIEYTSKGGIAPSSYPQGGTAGDIDGDGDLDLYLTTLGPNELWENRGDGSFLQVESAGGADDDLWGSSTAFADVDRDGDLDLYVANYVDFTVETHRPCLSMGTMEIYCYPGHYGGVRDVFYRNLGNGRFAEATQDAGLETTENRAALGVVFGDLDNDGWIDLYVANDAEANHLFLNRGQGHFEEVALLAGTAYSGLGSPEAGMGTDLGDIDNDGLLDIVVTNFELETNALYRNLGSGLFVDSRFALNVAESSLLNLAFGVTFADLDHDGDLDLAVANGHIHDNAPEINENSAYAQRNQILQNDGGGRFSELSGLGMEPVRVSRGLAKADLDGDGDLDLVFNNSDDVAEVYENLAGQEAGHWLQLDLRSSSANRFAIGARAELLANGGQQIREVRTASSFMSQGALTLHFGVGNLTTIPELSVRWPDGTEKRYLGLPVDRLLTILDIRPVVP